MSLEVRVYPILYLLISVEEEPLYFENYFETLTVLEKKRGAVSNFPFPVLKKRNWKYHCVIAFLFPFSDRNG